MSEEDLLLLLDKALQGLGSMKLTRYVMQALLSSFSLILLFIFKWFDRQKAYLDSLESQLRGLVKAIELVAKHRTGVFSFDNFSNLFFLNFWMCLCFHRVSRFRRRICTDRQRSFFSRCGQAIVPVVSRSNGS